MYMHTVILFGGRKAYQIFWLYSSVKCNWLDWFFDRFDQTNHVLLSFAIASLA